MSLVLPQNPEIRRLIDVAALARKEWAVFSQAKIAARRTFESDKAISRVFAQVIRAETGEVHLVSFGPRGGHKTLWNFGNPIEAQG